MSSRKNLRLLVGFLLVLAFLAVRVFVASPALAWSTNSIPMLDKTLMQTTSTITNATTTQTSGLFYGFVWNELNQSLAGANVTVSGLTMSGSALSETVVTGPDGMWNIALPWGSYTITVSAPGYQSQSFQLNWSADVDYSGDDVHLQPTVTPTVATLPAANVTATSAVLRGTVNPNGFLTGWDFSNPSETTIYCPSPPGNLPAENSTHQVSCTATGLEPSTYYEYIIRANNGLSSGEAVLGSSVGFTTATKTTETTTTSTSATATSVTSTTTKSSSASVQTGVRSFSFQFTYGSTRTYVFGGSYYLAPNSRELVIMIPGGTRWNEPSLRLCITEEDPTSFSTHLEISHGFDVAVVQVGCFYTSASFEIDSIITELAETYGEKQVFLIGHSAGGIAVASYVTSQPSNSHVRSAVILDATLAANPEDEVDWTFNGLLNSAYRANKLTIPTLLIYGQNDLVNDRQEWLDRAPADLTGIELYAYDHNPWSSGVDPAVRTQVEQRIVGFISGVTPLPEIQYPTLALIPILLTIVVFTRRMARISTGENRKITDTQHETRLH